MYLNYSPNVPIGFYGQSSMDYWGIQPADVKVQGTLNTSYYKRYLYDLVYSVFKFKLPDNWNVNYFRWFLFKFGSTAVFYTNELGWINGPYGVDKIDWQYFPLVINATNHALKETKKGIIGVNAQIIYLFDDYMGIDDLVSDYAGKLAQIDRAISINLMNANVTKAFGAEDKKQGEAIKQAYEDATCGKPLIVINKDILTDKGLVNLFGNVRNDFIADAAQSLKRQIINEFLTKIGIKNANYDKKERLNSMEVNENNDETSATVSVMYDNIKKCFERANRMPGLELDVTLRYEYGKEGGRNEVYPVGALPV